VKSVGYLIGKTRILKPLLRSLNTISFVLIIFNLQLIKTIRIIWFCHRSKHQDNTTGNIGNNPPTTPTPVTTTISQLLESQPDTIRWIWKQHQFDMELTEVVQWIRDGDTISVSDGSFKVPMGTSSWRILNRHEE
jgi:hypothetical protein